jgi:hypothetical protein
MSCYLAFDNYLDSVNSFNASSENASFPDDNLFTDRRVKVWRSNGYYNVTSSNNEIVFNEGASDVTATIPVLEYTSGTSFLLAVENALQDVSPNNRNYTVSYDATTGKIKVQVSTGTLNIKWDLSSAASLLGFNPTLDSSAISYVADSLKLHTNEFLLMDLGVSSIPYAFIAIGERNASIKISPTATLSLAGNYSNTFNTTQFSQSVTYDSSVLSYVNASGFDSMGYRYWRFNVVDVDNSYGYVELSNVFLGNIFNPSRGRVQFGSTFNHIDNSVTSYSIGGQSFSEIRSQTESFQLKYFALTNSEKQTLETVYRIYGTHTAFYLILDKDAQSITSTQNYYIRYVKFESPPSFGIESPKNWSANVSLREQL